MKGVLAMLNAINITKAVFTVTEVASLLHCSPDPVYRLVRNGKISSFKRGKSYFITAKAIEDYLNSISTNRKL